MTHKSNRDRQGQGHYSSRPIRWANRDGSRVADWQWFLIWLGAAYVCLALFVVFLNSIAAPTGAGCL